MLNFKMNASGPISSEFIKLGISDFKSACLFVAKLPYKRNENKDDLTCVFKDKGGTCSTKHATLRKLALEHGYPEVELILGIFKMDAAYTALIKTTLAKANLQYIPEAHNYLKIGVDYYDFTKENADYSAIRGRLLLEKSIEFDQINQYKIALHKSFLENWLKETKSEYSLHEIWEIRERCIRDLQN